MIIFFFFFTKLLLVKNMSEIDLKNYKIRTDLIVESIGSSTFDGITTKEKTINNIKVSDITVNSNIEELNKKKGKYITISFNDVTDTTNRKNVEKVLSDELRNLLNTLQIKETDKCLVVGLGNYKSTPDSLGPKVINKLVVTRHLYLIDEIQVDKGYREVSAFTPGVMGTTGIEAKDFIFGLSKEIKSDFVIVIDALASSSIERVNKTIQITDTGINPGSGVGNTRVEISKETIGIPVIAIGIPTVVDAVTIVSDTIKYLLKKFSYSKANINKNSNKLKPVTSINYLEKETNELSIEDKEKLLGFLGHLTEDEIHQLIFEVLSPIGYNLMVTPKEIDFVIDKLSLVLSTSINTTLHKQIQYD